MTEKFRIIDVLIPVVFSLPTVLHAYCLYHYPVPCVKHIAYVAWSSRYPSNFNFLYDLDGSQPNRINILTTFLI